MRIEFEAASCEGIRHFPQTRKYEPDLAIWPKGALHSTSPAWKPSNKEGRLLDFVVGLIVNLARIGPAVTSKDVANWIARVVISR